MGKSIIQPKTDRQNRECFLCRLESTAVLPHGNLEKHHFMHGTANRRLAEKWGLWAYLCPLHHWEIHNCDREKDIFLMQVAQGRFEQLYGHEKWMEVFGKNYLIM